MPPSNLTPPPPILVAEDEETDALILRMAAKQAGLANPLVVVHDGSDVVTYLEGAGQYADRALHPLPALLILDLKMPRMTGFDVLSWLGTHPHFKRLPAVVLSSSCQDSDVAKARDLGAREYHVKPHHLGEL